jgi:hypothetical protein
VWVVGQLGPLVSGDDEHGIEGREFVGRAHPLSARSGVRFAHVLVDSVVADVSRHDQPQIRYPQRGAVVGVGESSFDHVQCVPLDGKSVAVKGFGKYLWLRDLPGKPRSPETVEELGVAFLFRPLHRPGRGDWLRRPGMPRRVA